jgi:hypothetical protein
MKTKTAAALGIKRLYHYQSFEKPERLARIFTDGTLYFSRPRDFNDPWDCRPFFNKSALDDPGDYDRAVRWFVHCDRAHNTALSEEGHVRRENEVRGNRRLLEWMIDQMTAEMEKAIQEQYRVYCLSTHPDSTLMWAHYAASCRGVCLEFSVENELFCGALPVAYFDSYPRFDVAATDEDENLQPLLTKSAVWSYEDEFRLIVSEHPFVFPDVPTTKAGLLALPKGALRSVIVGAEMPASDRDVVKTLVTASEWGVELKVASLVPDRYEFEITNFKS